MIVSAPAIIAKPLVVVCPASFSIILTGGAVAENTMNANAAELASVALRQRVLCGAGEPTLATTILDAPWAMPVALGPVGATGMYARRGESPGGPRRPPAPGSRTPYPPCRSARLKRWRATPAARSGPSCTY